MHFKEKYIEIGVENKSSMANIDSNTVIENERILQVVFHDNKRKTNKLEKPQKEKEKKENCIIC